MTDHQWHIHLYAVAGHATESDEARTAMELTQLAETNFPVSFEQAAEGLQALDRMYFEFDGSFVWVGDQPQPWQIDGMLYDRLGRLHRVELKGWCPLMQWHELLKALGVEPAQIIAHLVEPHQLVDGIELFERWEQMSG